MRKFLIATLFVIMTPLAFAGSQRFNANLYSNYLKGLFFIQNEEYELGLKELEKAKAKDPKSIHTRLKIATVLIRLGKNEEAQKALLEAKKLDPDNLEISLTLIFIYSYAQKDKELEAEYEELLKNAHRLKPDDISISEYLAQFYFYKTKL